QLESWYRFLAQPDPFDKITHVGGKVTLDGVDGTILKQRADFLRPDSLLAVIVVTDEDDSTVDPMALGGQGWAYMNFSFPGGPGPAPKGTAACATDPNSADCTSCYFKPSDSACNPVFYDAADDSLNVRPIHMKQRFGVDPQFPVSR